MNSSICNNNNKKLFISKLIVLIADYIAIVLGTLAAYYLRLNLSISPVSSNFKVEEIYVYGVVPIVFLTILLLNNAYSVVTPYWDTMKNLFRSITIGVVVSIVLMYTGHVINDVSRLFVAFAYICMLVESVIKDTGVQTVLICAPGLESKKLVSLINQLQLLVKRVAFVPELFGLPTSNISARGMMEEQAVILRVQNNLARKSNRIFKRIFDIVATVCGGILILPILAIIAILIYLDSPGPIVFGHKRVGQGGKSFFCYKFRSMVPNAQEALEQYLKDNPTAREEWERDFKLKDDPRVTRIGKFLRKTSLDELPQLWNVLVGDMSLVGPRPIVRDEIVKYGDYINDFYLVPPGITGVWQVSGRSDTTYEERVLMDSWYVHNWSVWIDIVYLLKTVLAVVKSKGAY